MRHPAFATTAAETDRLAAVWRLALATGLRRGELLGCTWDGIDLDHCAVTVGRPVLVRVRSAEDAPGLYVRETTKTRRQRTVRFDIAAAPAAAAMVGRVIGRG